MSDLAPGSRVLLLDSSAVLKSCFEGYQATRTSAYNGRALDVAGLYGYLYRTMKIYESLDFEALVHVMDPPGGSHYRYNLYPEYKAKRKVKDPVLAAQEALIAPMLCAFGERLVCQRGVESDDILATMAENLADAGHQVMIISPDKDLMQLVSDGRISVARYVDNPGAMGKTYAFYEEKEVFDTMGVRPDQVADYLALVGDASDNIPGVFKCGAKTAVKWLAEYGDLATLMTHADKVGGKIGENLRAALPVLPLYQKLTSVLRDLPDIAFPPIPEPDDALHATMREVLVLPEDFPARFVADGPHQAPTATQVQAPAKQSRPNGTPATPAPPPTPAAAMGRPAPSGSYRPAGAPVPNTPTQARVANPDGLVAPAGDALTAPPIRDQEKLGALFAGQVVAVAPVVDDPFADPAPGEDPFAELGPELTQPQPTPQASIPPKAEAAPGGGEQDGSQGSNGQSQATAATSLGRPRRPGR